MQERVLRRPGRRRRRWVIAPWLVCLLAAVLAFGAGGKGLYAQGLLGWVEQASVALGSGW